MGTYAARTGVSVEKSKGEIERVLSRYGADEFAYVVRQDCAKVAFVLEGRRIQFTLPLPSQNDPKFCKTPTGRFRAPGEKTRAAALEAWEQACRQSWRALALAIKAKLEVVESGIATLEDEFLGYMVLPNGQTLSEWAVPQLDHFKIEMPRLVAKQAG